MLLSTLNGVTMSYVSLSSQYAAASGENELLPFITAGACTVLIKSVKHLDRTSDTPCSLDSQLT